MGKFDVTAAAGTVEEENNPAEAGTAPGPKKPTVKKSTPAPKKPVAKKPATTARKAAPKKSTTSASKARASIAAPTAMLEELLDEAEAQSEGLAQIAIRMPPSLKARLKTTMSRAGMKQEKFVAALIQSGLDDLEAILDSRDNA